MAVCIWTARPTGNNWMGCSLVPQSTREIQWVQVWTLERWKCGWITRCEGKALTKHFERVLQWSTKVFSRLGECLLVRSGEHKTWRDRFEGGALIDAYKASPKVFVELSKLLRWAFPRTTGFVKAVDGHSQYTDLSKCIAMTHMNILVRRYPRKALFTSLIIYYNPSLVLLTPFLLHILFYSVLNSLKRAISGEHRLHKIDVYFLIKTCFVEGSPATPESNLELFTTTLAPIAERYRLLGTSRTWIRMCRVLSGTIGIYVYFRVLWTLSSSLDFPVLSVQNP